MILLHLLGIILFLFGLIGLIRPSRLHQTVVIRKFSLEKRWGNLILVILGLAMLYSMIVDFMYVLGMTIFLFGLVGLIYPTRLHQTVAIRKFSLGKRLWNLLFIACSVLIMVVCSDQFIFGKNPTIPDKQKASPIEVAIKKLKDLGQEVQEAGQKQLAELAGLLNESEREVTHRKIEVTPKPAESKDPTVASMPPYRGMNVVCDDFSSSTEATAYMKAYGVNKLDRDGDGIACESLGPGNSIHVSTSKPPYRGMNLTCDDFATGDEVEAYMAAYGYIYDLDPDGDGVVCESTEFYPEEPPWWTPSPKVPDHWEYYEKEYPDWAGDPNWSGHQESKQEEPQYEEPKQSEEPEQSEQPKWTKPEDDAPSQPEGESEQTGQGAEYEESE